MTKNAYLILAHNEYEVLQELVVALDNMHNDIYIHIDKNVHNLPNIQAKYSRLIMLSNRKKVYWGCLEVVEAETALFECAYKSGIEYEYYHLISGTHFPLITISKIEDYFNSVKGKSVVQSIDDSPSAAFKRMGRYHFFLKYQWFGKF